MPAMLAGLGLRGAVAGRLVTGPAVDNVVDVDMALPGREPLKCPWPPGVTLPEREPKPIKIQTKISHASIGAAGLYRYMEWVSTK